MYGMTDIAYNHANQATDIWLSEGWRVVTSYGPDGTKLRSALASPEGWGVTVRKYLGNLVIEDDRVVQQLFPGGYFDAEGNAYYYLTDYQGNVTGVIDSNAKIVQETGYYPYGEPWLEPEGDNPYLYGGKERMALGGVRYSDFGPRLLSTASGYWGSPDPLCEDFRDLSPYINCAANPVRFSDPTGMVVIARDSVSMNNIINTLSIEEAKFVRFIDGMIDRDLINKSTSDSMNFSSLKLLCNSETNYIFSSQTEYMPDPNSGQKPHQLHSDPSEGTVGVTLIPGAPEEPSSDSNVYIITSSLLPAEGQVSNVAHEAYGHAFLYEQSICGFDVNPFHDWKSEYTSVYNSEFKTMEFVTVSIDHNTLLVDRIKKATEQAIRNYRSRRR